MNVGKLVALGAIGGLFWQYQDMTVQAVNFLRHFMPLASTYVEMESFRGRLGTYSIEHDGEMPANIGPWLNDNFVKPGKEDLGFDYFGYAYDTGWDDERGKGFLRSSGPDGEYDTDDDLIMRP